MTDSWNVDYLDLIDALILEQVEYLIVGAFAVAAHGFPRATGDIDVFVRPSPENAVRVVAALRRFGAPLAASGVTVGDFAAPGVVYQVGVAPRRVDVITEISGVSYDDASASRILRDVSGRSIPFIGHAELIRNKRATGRPKDAEDVRVLETLGPSSKG